MAGVRWTPQALDDLAAICAFIARDAPQVAAVFADRMFHTTDRLASHPRSGRIVPELEIENIREVILGNYRVIYRDSLAGQPEELPLTQAQRQELDRRIDEMDGDDTLGIPWEEVLRQIREQR